jgi:hypothetical protein
VTLASVGAAGYGRWIRRRAESRSLPGSRSIRTRRCARSPGPSMSRRRRCAACVLVLPTRSR